MSIENMNKICVTNCMLHQSKHAMQSKISGSQGSDGSSRGVPGYDCVVLQ